MFEVHVKTSYVLSIKTTVNSGGMDGLLSEFIRYWDETHTRT